MPSDVSLAPEACPLQRNMQAASEASQEDIMDLAITLIFANVLMAALIYVVIEMIWQE